MCVHIETISIPIAYVSPQGLHTNLCLLGELKQSAYTTPSCGVGVVASVGVGAVVGAGAGLDLVADRRRRTRTRDQDQACVGTTSKVEETTRGSPGGENGEGERRKHAGRKEEGKKESKRRLQQQSA